MEEIKFEFSKKYYYVIMIIVSVFAFISSFIFMQGFHDKYPNITTEDSLECKVENIRKYQSFTNIIDTKGNCYGVSAFNKPKDGKLLYYFINEGDSLSKKSGSDTIYLYIDNTNEVITFFNKYK